MNAKAKLLQRIKRDLEQYEQEHRRVTLLVSQFSALDGMPGNAVFRKVPWQGTDTVFVDVPCPRAGHPRQLYYSFLVLLAWVSSERAEITDADESIVAPLFFATREELLAAGIPPDWATNFVAMGNCWRGADALAKLH